MNILRDFVVFWIIIFTVLTGFKIMLTLKF
jgi:hypothetical protein